MRNGMSPRGNKSKARITPRTILRYLHYRRRITERDIRPRGTEPVQPQIIPTQVPAEAKPQDLGNDESVQEVEQARDREEDGQLPDRHSCIERFFFLDWHKCLTSNGVRAGGGNQRCGNPSLPITAPCLVTNLQPKSNLYCIAYGVCFFLCRGLRLAIVSAFSWPFLNLRTLGAFPSIFIPRNARTRHS